jgi:hypothetical protein
MQNSKRNGGNLSFQEAAKEWEANKPFFPVSTEDTSKYWAEKAKKFQFEQKK